MVENRRVGIKSRETYECPGALALLMAHADLEDLTLERDLHHEKLRLEPRWSELVYDGLWFSPLKQALDAFFVESQRHVTGEVRLRLDAGRCWVVGRRSPVSLYDYGLATYDAADTFRHQDAEGFVRLWGLGVATWSAVQEGRDPDRLMPRAMTLWHGRFAPSRRRGHGLLGQPPLRPPTGRWTTSTGSRAHVRGLGRRLLDRGGGGHPVGRPGPGASRSWPRVVPSSPPRTRTSTASVERGSPRSPAT